MKILLQRVKEARVTVAGVCAGSIDKGLLVFIGLEKQDDLSVGKRAIEKLLSYRIFNDASGRMNLSVRDVQGGILLVPQFTLVAKTSRGSRPSFSGGMAPLKAKDLFEKICKHSLESYSLAAAGCFGEDMHVALINDGPVTFFFELG